MARIGQFVGGLLWALSRPLRRRRIDRSPGDRPDPAPPPWAGRRRRWLRRASRGPRPGWHEYAPAWDGPARQADDEGPGRPRRLRRAICLGAGSCLLLATLVWLIAVVGMAITATSTTATVTGATSDGCLVSYTTSDGRHRTGDVDCGHVRVGSSSSVWVLSDDPGDVVDGTSLLGGGLTVTAAGAVIGATLLRIGRGRAGAHGRHAALSVSVALRVRWWLSRSSRRPWR